MNYRLVFRTLGRIMEIIGILMFLPLIVSMIYKEHSGYAFLITIGICATIGVPLAFLVKPKDTVMYAKEGFVIVALAWVVCSLVGAIPFCLSGEIASYVDAVFETASGFTTTGASILTNVESLSKGILFWRSFTHFLGGMGVLVFLVAVLPVSERGIHILRAEMPGITVGKLRPKARDTAKILYIIYFAMTMIETALLMFGGLNLFDSLVYSFGTAGTGGFGVYNSSCAFMSPYCQWVVTIFMALFGVNFNLYFFLLVRKFKNTLKNGELWAYISILAVSTIIITVNIHSKLQNMSLAGEIRTVAFQVTSIMTTTGYVTTDFNTWPALSKGILTVLMFIGACAGSTGGGLKVSRIVILVKSAFAEIRRLVHPRSVTGVRVDKKEVDPAIVKSVLTYFAMFFVCFVTVLLVVCLDNFSFETNFSAVAACINNIGPGFDMVGATGNYHAFSDLSKIFLSLSMLLGRLELFPILIMLTPSTWTKK